MIEEYLQYIQGEAMSAAGIVPPESGPQRKKDIYRVPYPAVIKRDEDEEEEQ